MSLAYLKGPPMAIKGKDAEQLRQESLTRAVSNTSLLNYGAIYTGFVEKGIPTEEILPRQNVFTFAAWKALGRSVKKGEHGVKVITWIETVDKDNPELTRKLCRTTTVFHVSQTQPMNQFAEPGSPYAIGRGDRSMELSVSA